jgi:hypothetical protein
VERIQRGRYMSVVSLAEAETIRGIIHMYPASGGQHVVEGALSAVALRVHGVHGAGAKVSRYLYMVAIYMVDQYIFVNSYF